MVNNNTDQNKRYKDSKTTRRTAIATMATAISFPLMTTASAHSSSDLMVVNRSYSDAISPSEVKSYQKELISEYRRNKRVEKTNYLTKAESKTGKLVSYVGSVSEDGSLKEHFGFVEDASEISKAHDDALNRSELIESEVSVESSTDTSTASTNEDWIRLNEGTRTNYNSFGDLWSSYEFLKHEEDSDAFCYMENFDQTPKDGYENNDGRVEMNWSNSNPDMELRDWEPYNGTDGSGSTYYEVSISPGGVTFGYETSWDMKIERNTDYSDQTVNFDAVYQGDGKTGSAGFQPSSTAKRMGGLNNNAFSVTADASFYRDCVGCVPDFERVETSQSFLPY